MCGVVGLGDHGGIFVVVLITLFSKVVVTYGWLWSGIDRSSPLGLQLVSIAESIISIPIVFTVVWVEIITPLLHPESALWSEPALLLALGSRRAAAEEAWSRAGGGRGRRGASVGGQGVRGRLLAPGGCWRAGGGQGRGAVSVGGQGVSILILLLALGSR